MFYGFNRITLQVARYGSPIYVMINTSDDMSDIKYTGKYDGWALKQNKTNKQTTETIFATKHFSNNSYTF